MVLREAELVEDRREKWNIFYRVVKPEIYAITDAALESTVEERAAWQYTLASQACPCPKCSETIEQSIR